MHTKKTLIGAALALAMTQSAAASQNNLKIHGFINAIGSVSDSNTKYLERIDKSGDWTNTDFGLNVIKKLTKN